MEERLLIEIIRKVASSLDFIILRETQKSPSEYLSFTKKLLETGVSKEKLYIHGRADIAYMTGIRNLHLPENGLPIQDLKHTFPTLRIGMSVHSLASARYAEKQGADYVMFGHIYQTDSKKGKQPRGLKDLVDITSSLHIPVIAIGGIKPLQAKDLYVKGAHGLAVMSGIFDDNNPLYAVGQYRKEAKLYETKL